jgi:hydrogenase maturation protein HypF
MAAQPSSLLTRKRLSVRGVVQGVGFRPYVYNLAHSLRLSGFILNTSAGVLIEIEGTELALDQFVDTLRLQPPSLSQISDIAVSDVISCGGSGFTIRESTAVEGEFALVSSDVGTCEDCWHDFSDPDNRRHRAGCSLRSSRDHHVRVSDVRTLPGRI